MGGSNWSVQPVFGSADDWIAEQAGPGNIVITSDIPLAAQCLRTRARVLGPKGVPFTEDAIGDALANGAGPPRNSPDWRSISSNARVARASPMASSVNSRPFGTQHPGTPAGGSGRRVGCQT